MAPPRMVKPGDAVIAPASRPADTVAQGVGLDIESAGGEVDHALLELGADDLQRRGLLNRRLAPVERVRQG